MLLQQVTQEEEVPAGGWSDKEIALFERRAERFMDDQMDAMQAEQLAQQMLYRDRDGSGGERRICLECKGPRGRVCTLARRLGGSSRMEPVRTMLQRCDAFSPGGSAW